MRAYCQIVPHAKQPRCYRGASRMRHHRVYRTSTWLCHPAVLFSLQSGSCQAHAAPSKRFRGWEAWSPHDRGPTVAAPGRRDPRHGCAAVHLTTWQPKKALMLHGAYSSAGSATGELKLPSGRHLSRSASGERGETSGATRPARRQSSAHSEIRYVLAISS
ncbi:hypothetical protein K431DRAFT_139693 [Polychaeton citri CBS 116435]|uniref:Uncharacterized protein n=1 Tax=Polychaeton citri CBS 116435 TaxID=1314669 RepID=A0A9P4Q4Y9_9PEZI|nr:hypothetical protein K431DRAFT_139693 [Polychaeton citri CBS 116435]